MKTLLFTILLIGWDIRNQEIFHSKIIKNHACKPNMLYDASNDRKYQKVIQNAVQRGDPKSIKIITSPPWDLPGSLRVHLWRTELQNGTKMVPKDLQMVQNCDLETLKGAENRQDPLTRDIANRCIFSIFNH